MACQRNFRRGRLVEQEGVTVKERDVPNAAHSTRVNRVVNLAIETKSKGEVFVRKEDET